MKLNSDQNKIHEKAISLSQCYRKTEGELIETLEKVSEEKIYLTLGYSSLFSYCVEALQFSEANAYTFSKISRKVKEIPELKKEIISGNISVSKARRIVPILTKENQSEWIAKATAMTRVELEKEVAKKFPESIQREFIRPVSENRNLFRIEISDSLLKKIKRAQTLCANKSRTNFNLEQTLEKTVDEFLKKNDPLMKNLKDVSKTTREKELKSISAKSAEILPNKNEPESLSQELSQVVPGPLVKNLNKLKVRIPISPVTRVFVFQRDKSQCQFRKANGLKCESSHYIDIHHRVPVSQGGTNSPANLVLLCTNHHRQWHDHFYTLRHQTLLSTSPPLRLG
ncbi:MAG: HNH endonuclease [Deltaproteobacteria bacterium]|nr:HNH endonuclease [Deltaproteobacteria bacterium]